MFGTELIVFRETLEAALFIGIIAASTRGLTNRSRWLALGASIGVIGSLLMASAMEKISAWAKGMGQDVLTIAILSVAILMLAWHSIWVSAHAKDMGMAAKRIGSEAATGAGTLWALSVAVALSVLREGAETVLFVSGLISGSQNGSSGLLLSVSIGLGFGALAGWLIYAGLGRIKPQRLFAVTNVLILLLAGSLTSQLAKALNQANWLTLWGDQAWDMSALISNDSVLGMLLHGVVGYDATPTQMQVVFYLSSIAVIWFAAKKMKAHVAAA